MNYHTFQPSNRGKRYAVGRVNVYQNWITLFWCPTIADAIAAVSTLNGGSFGFTLYRKEDDADEQAILIRGA